MRKNNLTKENVFYLTIGLIIFCALASLIILASTVTKAVEKGYSFAYSEESQGIVMYK